MANLVKKIRTSSGDLQIDYNALANLPRLGSQNLLINSDFRNLINQRDKSSYTGSSSWIYTIDRWRIKGITLTVNDGSITLTNSGSSQNSMQQPIGYTLPTGSYTVSLNVLSISGNVSVGLTGTSNNPKLSLGINSHTWNDIAVGSVAIALDPGASIKLEWVKLEGGSVATPFVPRLYVEEFILCQSYYRQLRRVPIYATATSNTTYMLPIQFGVPMIGSQKITLVEALNSSGTVQSGITCTNCLSGQYSTQTIQLSSSIGQYGFITLIFDAEIY